MGETLREYFEDLYSVAIEERVMVDIYGFEESRLF